MDLSVINNIAFELMGNKSSHGFKEKGNKYYHGQRVATLAVKLRKLVMPDDSSHDDIITVAAWLHDVMNGMDDHAREGAIKTREVLSSHCTDEELEKICKIIGVHDDRYTGRDTYSPYIKIHQDADHLDHFGTFDIWMIFLYAVAHGETINDVRDFLSNDRPKENEKYKSELNFEISRKIFDEKMEFLKYFTERFCVESTGGIWNEDNLWI